jgi:hypothetical protein
MRNRSDTPIPYKVIFIHRFKTNIPKITTTSASGVIARRRYMEFLRARTHHFQPEFLKVHTGKFRKIKLLAAPYLSSQIIPLKNRLEKYRFSYTVYIYSI